jgi:cytidylate kinase
VYISADIDYRIKKIADKYDISESEAIKLIQRRDKQRAAYYNFYTCKKWSEVNSYDLCINSAGVGVDGAVQLILNYLELRKIKGMSI